MITRYYNLSDADISTLKALYCISYRDKVLDEQETAFLIQYRNKLAESIEYIWKAHVGDYDLNMAKATAGIVEVAELVESYMKATTAGNIKQRMLFVNNMSREVEAVHNYIQWALHKYSSENAIRSEEKEKDIVRFLQAIAVQTLENGFNQDELLKENAYMQVYNLRKNLSKKFLSYIDKNKLTFYDNYFLIGECLHQISELEKQEKEIFRNKCDNCLVDDCAISRCADFSTQIDIEKQIKVYKKIIDLCAKRLNNQEVSQEELERICAKIDNDELKLILARLVEVPAIETRTDRIKKININSLTSKPELIDAVQITEKILETMHIAEDKKYYEDINLITSSLLLTRCDYSGTKGEEIVVKFKKIEELVKGNLGVLSITYFKKLIECYKQKELEKENK